MPLTLLQYNRMLKAKVASHPELQAQWVAAELIDVRIGTHAYMDLIEKDASGATVARMRATIWRGQLIPILSKFRAATGRDLGNGLKVLVRGSAGFHESYGLSFNIIDIDPSYTLGDIERLRREILDTLRREGVLSLNKELQMPPVVQKIAVISAAGAAGYGDFMNQLSSNPLEAIYYPVLFQATVQGERTASSVIDALQRIEMSIDAWDCVVIIRGGGASADLEGFDNLNLARAVATYPLPIIVGIGHERDRTVLDEIAHTRVKTPTAAAEFIVNLTAIFWARMEELMRIVTTTAQQTIMGSREQLSQLETRLHTGAMARTAQARSRLDAITALLPAITQKVIADRTNSLNTMSRLLTSNADSLISRQRQKLDFIAATMAHAAPAAITQASEKLRRLADMAHLLSPAHTLERGYTLTLHNGKAVTNAAMLNEGDEITTLFNKGKITATINTLSSEVEDK